MVLRYERMRHVSTGRFGMTMIVKGGGRLFVMKTIDASRLGPVQRRELVREVSALAQLRHPHIDTMRESFLEGGSLCVVTEYVEGGNLAIAIDRAKSSGEALPDARVLQWFAQAALALRYMHEAGVLHRDLRARRLLLTPQGHVVLSGAATSVLLASSLAPERPDLEALRYLAPELLAGPCCHAPASDIWALGVVLFEMLALRPPFEHTHPFLLAEQIRRRPLPPSPPQRAAELRELCAALLRREPAARPSAAEALREPGVQRRLLLLLAADAGPLPELRVAGFVAGPPTGGRGAAGTPMRVSPLGGPCATGVRGPLVLAGPRSTPRGLRRAGERCLQGCAREARAPPARLRKHGEPPEPAAPLDAAEPGERLPSTPNVAAGEMAVGLVAEVLDDVSLAATHLLDGSSPRRALTASGPLFVDSPSAAEHHED